MLKVVIFTIFFSFINFSSFCDDLINKIVYSKTVIDFEESILVNVYLSQVDAEDVIVVFNNDELTSINKNLKPYIKDDNNFSPSFSFEVSKVKKENSLQIFVVLSQGITVNTETTLFFEKGPIVDNNNFHIRKDRYFFIKAGEFVNDEIFYNMEIDNEAVIEKIDEITKNNILYYRLKSKKEGSAKVDIYKYDESLEKQSTIPFKSFRITISNQS